MSFLMQFPRVHLDFGAVKALPVELAALGITRPLLLTDQGLVKCGVAARVLDTVRGRNDLVVFDTVPENPTVAGVEAAYEIYRREKCDGVVALGGGSVIDTAKAVAVLGGHPGPITNYMGKPDTIDYAIVIEGEIYALMDEGEKLMKTGDVLIQRGTNHAWSNRADKPARVAFILIDAKPV